MRVTASVGLTVYLVRILFPAYLDISQGYSILLTANVAGNAFGRVCQCLFVPFVF